MSVANAPIDDRPAAVYRLWTGDGALLYVGSSYDPEERCKQHRPRPWWPGVTRRTDEWYDTRIAREDPLHNVYGTGRDTEAMRRRTEMGKARGAVQRAAYTFARSVLQDAVASGLPSNEAHRMRRLAFIDFLDGSGVAGAVLDPQQRPLDSGLPPGLRAGVPAFGVGPDVDSEGAQVLLKALPPRRVHGLAHLTAATPLCNIGLQHERAPDPRCASDLVEVVTVRRLLGGPFRLFGPAVGRATARLSRRVAPVSTMPVPATRPRPSEPP
ncbi:GIY-YIG nuclease family protein [Streptomyces olivochromogenes]|uniref:hypothetical protein n=1 Tax=Streptomyces olivochromogenes TaxID=1963 RepID=UPI0036A26169